MDYANKDFGSWQIFKFILQLAGVPGAAWINLQPADHLLFCKQFSKMCPSAFSV